MKKILLFIIIISIKMLYGQNEYVHQVLLLNEGSLNFDTQEVIEPVKIGAYNPSTNSYNTIIEIPDVKFATDLVIYENWFFVAADNRIFKYDLDTYELLNFVDVAGVRKICIYDEYLFITKGDYDNNSFGPVIFNSYLEVYSVFTLDFIYSFNAVPLEGPEWSTESIISDENNIYVSINNGFEWGNFKGIVGVIEASTLTYVNEIDLGENGINPISMFRKDDIIYTLNNKNFDGSSLSVINTTDIVAQVYNLPTVSSGCGASIIKDDKLYYQDFSEDQVYEFNINNFEESGVVENLNNNFYTMSEDPVNGYLYASVTDYNSNNQIMIYDQNNELLNSFIADVSTSKIVFDIRNENVDILDIDSINSDRKMINTIDYLGRAIDNNSLNLKLYDDGSVDKSIIIQN